mgnify:CR=1 FL=1
MKHKYLKDVSSLKLDSTKCIKCGRCTEVCPHEVFEMTKELNIVDKDSCMECGACALNCPTQALSVNAGVGCAAAMIYGALIISLAFSTAICFPLHLFLGKSYPLFSHS